MSGKVHPAIFKPRARILELLGEQLIRDHRIALFELVKNSYDADSPYVTLHFHNLSLPTEASIEIIDAGEGMDLETVLNIWLEPASDHKAEKLRNQERTTKFERLPVGEKGVGRFAVHKLGNTVRMVTRKKGALEIEVNLDWKSLTSNRYLSDASFLVNERKPEVFLNNNHGTLIEVSNLKTTWTRGDVRRLYRAVSTMVSPFNTKDPFSVNFILDPESETWVEDLFSPVKAKESSLYEFTFSLDDNVFVWNYSYTPFPSLETDFKNIVKSRNVGSKNDAALEWFALEMPDGTRWRGRKKRKRPSLESLRIGPIKGRILGFDLDKELIPYLGESVGLKEYLKEQGGIRVYRDGMRVYDYGEPDNDWLGLDERRFQQPVKRLSNNLILGEIQLNLSKSEGLKEKTNREGFIENLPYKEFRYAIQSVLAKFEAERSKDKDILRKAFAERKRSQNGGVATGPEEAIRSLRKKVLEEGLQDKLGVYIERIEKAYEEARDILMSAVGSGLGLSMVFHEIERGIRGLLRLLEVGSEKDMDKVLDMARGLSDLLQGAAWMVRTSRTETFDASEIVKAAIFSIQPRFKFHRIALENGFVSTDHNFKLRGSRRMIVASLVNLLDNSLHWVKVREGSDPTNHPLVWIGPGDFSEGNSIIVADSGVGFEDSLEDVTKPFFTRRMDGMGLGLYYVDMTMKNHRGRISFPNRNDIDVPNVCDGGVVALIFPNKENS